MHTYTPFADKENSGKISASFIMIYVLIYGTEGRITASYNTRYQAKEPNEILTRVEYRRDEFLENGKKNNVARSKIHATKMWRRKTSITVANERREPTQSEGKPFHLYLRLDCLSLVSYSISCAWLQLSYALLCFDGVIFFLLSTISF